MAEIGYKTDGGEARKDVIESLDRLSNVLPCPRPFLGPHAPRRPPLPTR